MATTVDLRGARSAIDAFAAAGGVVDYVPVQVSDELAEYERPRHAGHEWWGAFRCTVDRPTQALITVIAASTAD